MRYRFTSSPFEAMMTRYRPRPNPTRRPNLPRATSATAAQDMGWDVSGRVTGMRRGNKVCCYYAAIML